MKKSRFSEEQIIGILREAEAGSPRHRLPRRRRPGAALSRAGGPLCCRADHGGYGVRGDQKCGFIQARLDGFKKSFRHERLVPKYAVVDPQLLASCPLELIAANGMDAFTQLLESYVSTRANPITDALAMSGIRAVRDSLVPWFKNEGDIAEHRANMAYGALISGITLAQVGLGSVHGLAGSTFGGILPDPARCGVPHAGCRMHSRQHPGICKASLG